MEGFYGMHIQNGDGRALLKLNNNACLWALFIYLIHGMKNVWSLLVCCIVV